MTFIRRTFAVAVLTAPTLLLIGEGPPVFAARCTVVGTNGDDVLTGTRGSDVVCGRGGNDVLRGLGGDDVLRGGAGNDQAQGNGGDDVLRGGSGRDEMDGGWGEDLLVGNRGNDTVMAGRGADETAGGPGVDTISFAETPARTGVTIDLRAGTVTGPAGTDMATSFENAVGSEGQDTLTGTDGKNVLRGGGAVDRIYPGMGDDHVDGGLGEYWDRERFYGDKVDYSDIQGVGVQVDLTEGTIGGTGEGTIVRIEHVTGTAADDNLIGDDRANGLVGLAGDDMLFGREDNDWLNGDSGDDFLELGPAAGRGDMEQMAFGDEGLDVISHVDLQYGIYAIRDSFSDDWLISADGTYTATRGLEVLKGTSSADEIYGGLGVVEVTIHGMGGADIIDTADGYGGDHIIQEPDSGSTCTSDPSDIVTGC